MERQQRFCKDHQGSVVAIADDKGKIVESYRYDAFGNLILGFQKNDIKFNLDPSDKNAQKNVADSKMWITNNRLYTAREWDEELGLYYYRGRHYEARMGRFMQRDPIGYADDVNLYTYVGNNPVNYVDPWGLSKEVHTYADFDVIHLNRLNYEYKGPMGEGNAFVNGFTDAGAFTINSLISVWNGVVDVVEYGSDYAGRAWNEGFRSANGKVVSDVEETWDGMKTFGKTVYDMSRSERGDLAKEIFTDVETYENLVGGLIGTKGIDKLGKLGKIGQIANTVDKVVPDELAKFALFKHASKYGIDTYKNLKKALGKNSGLEVHHLIEKRFKDLFGGNANDMQSIVLTETEHQMFTNLWRNKIGYEGSKNPLNTLTATKEQVQQAAREIYAEYPEILEALDLN